jgi:hypothetical protein
MLHAYEKSDPKTTDVIVKIVNAPFGTRPSRVTVDPAQDGSEVVTTVMDRSARSTGIHGKEYLALES